MSAADWIVLILLVPEIVTVPLSIAMLAGMIAASLMGSDI